MAEEEIRKELICSICLEIYTDPKILQCFHVYCQKCLVKLVFRDQEGELVLPCPICRQVTFLPASTTASLPSAFQVKRITEILEEHNSSSKKPPAICCSEHGAVEAELYCETCEKFVCYKCVIHGGKHHSHDYKTIGESFETYKQQLAPLLKQLEKKSATITKVSSQLDRQCDEILQQQDTIKASIQDCSKNLIEIINRRRDQLLDKIDKITKEKIANLATQKDRIMILQSQLSSCVDFTNESMKEEPQQHEVLVMKTDILKQVKKLATPLQPDTVTLCTEADIVFASSTQPATTWNELGRVYTPNSLDPSKCIALDCRELKEAAVSEKAFAKLKLINMKGELCSKACESDSIQVDLVSSLTGRVIHGCTEPFKGQFFVSYQPVVKGQHKLYIKVDGKHIKGSPFNILVKQPVENLGVPVKTFGGSLHGPTDVAINRKGEMIVTDNHAHCVAMFTPHGRRIRSFGTYGSKEGQFKEPFSVTVNKEDSIIVSDLSNHRIQKFSRDGTFLKAVGLHGNGKLEFNQPHGISYSASNDKLYVCDSLNHRIQVLNSDLTFCKTFGKAGSRGQFKQPIGIATDSTGEVYVTDYYGHQIQVFTPEGRFLRMFGNEAGTGRSLDLPYGIAVDASGFVYVSDFNTHCISVFSKFGAYKTSFGSKGEKPGQLAYPYGLAVHDGGVLCVCDFGNYRIQIF